MIQKIRYSLLLFLSFGSCLQWATAQTSIPSPELEIGLPYIENFSPTEYGAGPTNIWITQSDEGLIYVANEDGVLEYDGTTWRLIPLPNGMYAYSVSCGSDGLIYVGGDGDLGYLAPNANGQLAFVSLLEKIPAEFRDFNDTWGMTIREQDVFFSTDKYFFRWNVDQKEEEMQAWKARNIYHACFTYKGEIYVWEWEGGLVRLEGDSLRVVPGGEAFAKTTIRLMAPISIDGQEKTLIGTVQKGLFIYDGQQATPFTSSPKIWEFLNENSLYYSVQLHDGNYALATSQGGIAIIDQQGNLMRIIDKSKGLQDNGTAYIFPDRQGGLWVALLNGISRIRIPSSFTFFSDELGLTGNINTTIHGKNEFWAASTSGWFTKTPALPADYRTFFQKRGGAKDYRDIRDVKVVNGDVLVASNAGFYCSNCDSLAISTIYSEVDGIYPSHFHSDLVFLAMGNEIGIVQQGAQQWQWTGRIPLTGGRIRSIAEAAPNLLWVTTNDQVVRIKIEDPAWPQPPTGTTASDPLMLTTQIDTFDQSHHLPTGTSLAHRVEDNIVFSTPAGIRQYDDASNRFIPDDSWPYNDTTRIIHPFSVQPNGDIWLISQDDMNADLIQFKRTSGGEYLLRSQNFKQLLSKGMSVNSIDSDPANRDIVWISTSEGLVKYIPTEGHPVQQSFPSMVRRVLTGDSTLLDGNKTTQQVPELAYKFNALRFEYTALSYDRPAENRYRVWLEGFDSNWSDWTEETKKDYTNLPEGDYVFRVKARNVYGLESEEGHFTFSIDPPWYRSWWAYLSYLLAVVGSIYGLVRWRVYQLRQHNRQLELLVHERTEEVEAQKQQLLQLDQLKSRFFTNISHEFRTPLTIIGGMAQQIEKSPDTWLHKGVKAIKRNNANLLNLVNQILDLRKLETGTLSLHLIQGDIIQYLQFLVESFHSLAESKGVHLHFLPKPKEVIMDYDKEKILRILSNLLSNAIKFTPEGGNIYVTVETTPMSTDNQPTNLTPAGTSAWLEIVVKDTGLGIPEDKLPHIFDRFYQVDDSSTRPGEGTGIGLSLTYELIKLLQGNITVESAVHQGTTFSVLLPISRQAAGAPSDEMDDLVTEEKGMTEAYLAGVDQYAEDPGATISDQEQLPTLLIIEDNQDLRTYMESLLEAHYHILLAQDGEVGIEMALEHIPDLILSDVMMPKKDGFEVCATLKQDERTSHIPMVLLTAKADVDSKLAGLQVGADAYLAKPFNEEELFIRLQKLHELRRQLQARYSSLESHKAADDSHVEDAFITKLRTIVEENLGDETFGIPELCRAIGMHRSQLHRKITALTNRSTSHFIRAIRLEKSKELLLQGELNVTQVAYEVGFYDRAYFSRVFSSTYGLSPKDFLQSNSHSLS